MEDDFDVYIAADRPEAMEVLKNERVDVMLTDLRLGADDGMDAFSGLKGATVVEEPLRNEEFSGFLYRTSGCAPVISVKPRSDTARMPTIMVLIKYIINTTSSILFGLSNKQNGPELV